MKYEFVIDYGGLPALVTVKAVCNFEVQPADATAYVTNCMNEMTAGQYYPSIKSFALDLARELLCSNIEELEEQSDEWEGEREEGVIY